MYNCDFASIEIEILRSNGTYSKRCKEVTDTLFDHVDEQCVKLTNDIWFDRANYFKELAGSL